MAWPAILARIISGALGRYAPKAVGAALRILRVVEIADLARDAWHALFGDDAEEAAAGVREGVAPDELVELIRSQLAAADALPGGGANVRFDPDKTDEETILENLERATTDRDGADLVI